MSGPDDRPRRVFSQRRRGHSVKFELAPEGLRYWEQRDRDSTQATIPWAQIPSEFHFTTSSDAGYTHPALLASLLVGYGFVLLNRDAPLQTFGLVAVGALAFTFILRMVVRSPRHSRTRINCPTAKLTVFHDKSHDEIIHAITRTRAAYFRRFTRIDPRQSKRKQLRSLRRLVELDVLTEDEFDLARARIMPYGPRTLLRNPPPTGVKIFTQRTLFTERTFIFREDHFDFRRSNFRCRTEQKIRYVDLRDLKSLSLGFEREPVAGVVAAWAMLLVVALGLHLEVHPIPPFAWLPRVPLTGVLHATVLYGPLFGLGVLIILGHRRFGMLRHSGVARLFSILRDSKHDEILEELKARRASAMRALADIDPLLTVEEQETVLTRLRDTGVLSERMVQERLNAAIMLQKELALDDEEVRPPPGPKPEYDYEYEYEPAAPVEPAPAPQAAAQPWPPQHQSAVVHEFRRLNLESQPDARPHI